MKKLLFIFTCLFIATITNAKIWRVNNTGAPADFTNAQSAHDGAAAGDTLHFEASGTHYGDLTVSKKIVIIGNGYYLGTLASNSNPDLQANTASSVLNSLVFTTGSNNSVVEGMSVNNSVSIVGGASNILIRRNRLNNVGFGSCNSIQLLQNYIFNGNPFATVNNDGNAATNLQINNNIVANAISFTANCSGDCMNNIVAAYAGGNLSLTNFRVWNNISVQGSVTLASCDSRNNIGHSTQFGNLNGNQQNVTMTNVFEDPNNSSPSFSEDSRWQLKAGSPAIGAAWNGVTTSGDCGVFGTSATGIAYVLSGIPNVPSIYKLSAPSTVTSNTMNITISTKVNQ